MASMLTVVMHTVSLHLATIYIPTHGTTKERQQRSKAIAETIRYDKNNLYRQPNKEHQR